MNAPARKRLVGLVAAVLLAAAPFASAAPAGGEAPAKSAATTSAETPAAPEAEFGPPSGGLALALVRRGEVAMGGTVAVEVLLKSAAGQAVALPAAKDVFGWVVIAQSTPGSKKAFYSAKIFPAQGKADWPAELKGDAPLRLTIDLTAVPAFTPDDSRKFLMAYLSGKDAEAIPPPVGKMSEVLMPGRAMAKFTLCLPASAAGQPPTLVTSASLDILVAPPAFASMKPEARQAFIADLLKQYDRDPWSGQQAHDTAVRMGKDLLDALIPAASEAKRPSHARLWLATTLADIRDDRAADALAKLLDDPMGGVQSVVCYHGPKQNQPKLDKAILDKAQVSKDSGLAAWALLGFMVHRASVPEELLKAGLESEDPKARAKAAEVMAQHSSEFNIERLTALLKDKDERVRSTAAAMLGRSTLERKGMVVDALIKALDSPGDGARQRIAAALTAITGQAIPYDPKADAATREKAVAAWKEWWAKQLAK